MFIFASFLLSSQTIRAIVFKSGNFTTFCSGGNRSTRREPKPALQNTNLTDQKLLLGKQSVTQTSSGVLNVKSLSSVIHKSECYILIIHL